MRKKPLSWNIIHGLSIQAQPVAYGTAPRRKKGIYIKVRFIGGTTTAGKRIPSKTFAANRDTYDDQYAAGLMLACKLHRVRTPPHAWIIRQPSWDELLERFNIVETIHYRYDQK